MNDQTTVRIPGITCKSACDEKLPLSQPIMELRDSVDAGTEIRRSDWQERCEEERQFGIRPVAALLWVALLCLTLCAAHAESLTLSLSAPAVNVTSARLIDLRWAIGATVPQRITNTLSLAARSFTYTNLTFGTNVITLQWSNAHGSTSSRPLTFVSLPDTSAPAQPPTPGHGSKKKPPQPSQPMVAAVVVSDD